MAYKYQTAYDWLMSHVDGIISQAQESGDPDAMLDATNRLRSIISDLGIKHDSDTIQDLYDHEMDADDYFDEVEGESVGQWVIAAGYAVGQQIETDALTYPDIYYSLDEAKNSISETDGHKIYGLSDSGIVLVEVD